MKCRYCKIKYTEAPIWHGEDCCDLCSSAIHVAMRAEPKELIEMLHAKVNLDFLRAQHNALLEAAKAVMQTCSFGDDGRVDYIKARYSVMDDLNKAIEEANK